MELGDIIAGASLVLSLIALIFSFKFNFNTFKPFGKIDSWKEGEIFQIVFKNYGMGPLFVSEIKLFYKEKYFEKTLFDFLEYIGIKKQDIKHCRIDARTINLASNEKTYLIAINTTPYIKKDLYDHFNQLKIEITYKGVYNSQSTEIFQASTAFKQLF